MYHEVPSGLSQGTADYYAVPVGRFVEQMIELRELGLRAVSLETLMETRQPNLVALTFDDGHVTHYTSAFPVLAKLGFSATFFVTTSWTGREPYLSWSQLIEMSQAGMSIQSHTLTHPFLSAIDRDSVARELQESKRQLDQHLSQDTLTLALPGGDSPRRQHSDLIRASGYRILATSTWGANRERGPGVRAPAVVRRYTVRADTSLAQFRDLALGRSAAWSREGLRLRCLSGLRKALGTERYARWRSEFLEARNQ
jgi:peptidoglycan/xylan/chitin deacetylase (PgdA/CDA1 family)